MSEGGCAFSDLRVGEAGCPSDKITHDPCATARWICHAHLDEVPGVAGLDDVLVVGIGRWMSDGGFRLIRPTLNFDWTA